MAWLNRNPPRDGAEQPLPVREREVWEPLSKGLPCKETADMLGVGSETVQKPCHNIYEKLQASSRTEAVRSFWANERGPATDS